DLLHFFERSHAALVGIPPQHELSLDFAPEPKAFSNEVEFVHLHAEVALGELQRVDGVEGWEWIEVVQHEPLVHNRDIELVSVVGYHHISFPQEASKRLHDSCVVLSEYLLLGEAIREHLAVPVPLSCPGEQEGVVKNLILPSVITKHMPD